MNPIAVANPASLAASLASRSGLLRMDPFGAFNFLIEIDGVLTGGFSEISGLAAETEVEIFHEGGVNDQQHLLLGKTSYPKITLKHGISAIDTLWSWYAKTIAGTPQPQNATIFMLDNSGWTPAMWWNLIGAIPVSWKGPDFKAEDDTVAFEEMTLAFQHLDKPVASQLAAAAQGVAGNLVRL